MLACVSDFSGITCWYTKPDDDGNALGLWPWWWCWWEIITEGMLLTWQGSQYRLLRPQPICWCKCGQYGPIAKRSPTAQSLDCCTWPWSVMTKHAGESVGECRCCQCHGAANALLNVMDNGIMGAANALVNVGAGCWRSARGRILHVKTPPQWNQGSKW